MSAVAPIVAGTTTLQQPLPPQTPSLNNTHPSSMPTFISSDNGGTSVLYTNGGGHNNVMIQTNAQAQQLFRQNQLLVYQQQQQQQFRLQQQMKHTPRPPPPPPPPPPVPQQEPRLPTTEQQQQDHSPQIDMMNKQTTPIQTNDTTCPMTPTLLKNTKRPGLYHRRHSTGHAVLRLLQFAEQLDPGDQALQRGFWDGFISDFFTKSSKTKLGLRNSHTDEQRPFYISHYSVAKFFHTLYESGGVSSIQLTLEQTMEFILPGGHMNVECPRANFIYRYTNGSLVSSTGHLWVRFSLTSDRIWKIKHFEFACQRNEEFISRSHLVLNKDGSKLKKPNKNTLPESPINAWGIPPKAFDILQMMDATVQLDDIIFYSLIAGTTAKDSLASLALDMEQTKDILMDNHTALDTPDPPATPGESDLLPSPPPPSTSAIVGTNKKQPTRRKSLKNGKSIKQEIDQVLPVSPIIKPEMNYPLQQQQQAFFQQQRKMLLEQQQQQQMYPTSPMPVTYQQQQQPSSESSQNQVMTYPPSIQTYPGTSQQGHELTQSPRKQFKKRRDSMNENKKPPIPRKKGKSTTTTSN